jgi:ATP-dependent DNA helicase RecG
MTVEFKSDRKKLSDRELIETLVCLANSEGGELWLGVEDDGTPTGLHADHAELSTLPAFIASRTAPRLDVRVTPMEAQGVRVARIEVPVDGRIYATTDGVYKRRRMQADGEPECEPFLPHEIPSRLSQFGSMDPTAQPVAGATLADLDPLERERLRQIVERRGGDAVLGELEDEALDGALGLTVEQDGERVPTLLGLLLIGREPALRQHVPAHEVAFQVLEQEAVQANEFTRAPLLQAMEWLETMFRPYNPEQELQMGLYRIPVPRVEERAFRETVANALTHRDYTRLGAVHVKLETNALEVSNPGGFVEGVSLDNLLTVPPHPRNPALADAFKRIGLVERSGRGVDLIYRGLLRYGRAQPDYSRTTRSSVVVRLSMAEADLDFLRLILEEEERRQGPLPVESLMVLSALREARRLSSRELAEWLEVDMGRVRQVVEPMVESGLVEAHGAKGTRTYTLSGNLYRQMGQEAEYVRQSGFDRIQKEQMVLSFVREHGRIRRRDAMELCRITGDEARHLLKRMVEEGHLKRHGEKRGAYYTLTGDRE